MIRTLRVGNKVRWPLFALSSVTATGLVVGGLKLRGLIHDQLPGILKSRLEAALGRKIALGDIHIFPNGIWVDDLRVYRMGKETVDPLFARSLGASLDWWDLLTQQRLRVNGVELVDAQVRLSPATASASREPWTAQLLSLSRSGVGRFRVRNASVEMLGNPVSGWNVKGVTGDLVVEPEQFLYQLRLKSLAAAGTSLNNLKLKGTGDREGVRLAESLVEYAGGRFEARGAVAASGKTADLKIRVKHLPLSRLSDPIGIPVEWAMKGDVTGDVTVDAREGTLRRVHGALHLNRGSLTRDGGVFPWTSADAQVDWTPERTTLKDVRVRGNGVELTLGGTVDLEKGQPFTAGRFRTAGEVVAKQRAAVAQVAELLAFRKALEGRWHAEKASVKFQAEGSVGELAQATATGRIRVDGLKLQPTPTSDQVTVSQLAADLRRTPKELALSNLRIGTEGVAVAGKVVLTNDRPGGTLHAEGRADIEDLKSLKKAVPEASLWKWVPSVSSSATASVDFKVDGPAAQISQWKSSGRFELNNFRLGARSPLPNKAMFFIPVRTARAEFRHAGMELELRELELDTPTFQAAGNIALGFGQGDASIRSQLSLQTDDWRALPAMPVGALPELQGGLFEAEVRFEGPYSRLNEVPIDGSFRLVDAEYLAGREGAQPVPVREVAARFRWARPEGADRSELQISSLTVDTPVLTAEAIGRTYPGTEGYRVELSVEGSTTNAGDLAGRWLPGLKVEGGKAAARVHVDTPLDGIEHATLTGNVEIHGARLLQNLPVLGVTAEKGLPLDGVTADFRREGGRWILTRAHVEAPALVASLSGTVTGETIDAEVEATASRWVAPERLPVHGGTVTLKGHVNGPLAEAAQLQYAGHIDLKGAQPRYAAGSATISGGRVTLSAEGAGSPIDPLTWVQSGSVEIDGARVALRGKNPRELTVKLPATPFNRDGNAFVWNGARPVIDDVAATVSGRWSPEGHRVTAATELADFRKLGLRMPEGVAVGKAAVEATVTGTSREPLERAEGSFDLTGVKLAVAGAPAQALDRLEGAFEFAGRGITLRQLEGRGPAGTITGSGVWSDTRREVAVTLTGSDFAKFGYALPAGFKLGGYRLQANVTATPQGRIASGQGTLQVTKAQFPFGEGQVHQVDSASTRLAFDGKRIVLSDLLLDGGVGKFTGSGELATGGYRLDLASDAANGDLVRWLVPGAVNGGHLSGTILLRGSNKTPVSQVSGKFVVRDAVYTLPKTLGLLGEPARVKRLAGEYRWADGRTVLSNLSLDSDLGQGTGTMTVADGRGTIAAELKTGNGGRVADFWPALVGRLQGATGEGTLNAKFDPAGIRGTIALRAAGGRLVLPNTPAEYAEQPIETASLLLGFEPGKLTFTNVKLRGPKANVDGNGSWVDGGAVTGKGKAWFAKSYTSQLIKPSGMGWLAKLVGIREIKSDFTVSGTSDRVMLKAGITGSMLWKLAKGRVPKEFQQILAGKNPLWTAPPADATVIATVPGEPAERQPAPAAPAPAHPASAERPGLGTAQARSPHAAAAGSAP